MKTFAQHGLAPGAWRELVRLVLASLATGAVVSIVLALAVFMVATEAHAASVPLADASQPGHTTARAATAALAATEAPPV